MHHMGGNEKTCIVRGYFTHELPATHAHQRNENWLSRFLAHFGFGYELRQKQTKMNCGEGNVVSHNTCPYS